MLRSIFITLFLIVLASNVAQTDGLAAIIRRVRNVGLFGIRRAEGVPHAQRLARAVTDPSKAVFPVTASFDSFDVELYRREITDLVYQRNMQRLHVN
jgi:hypothetical protein